ncbi:MAG: endonuclease [Rhodobacteraceae bacterium]|nr:endonuclease [Paracoccaceae bacterium]
MRLATYNVEWFDKLFDDTGELSNDDLWSGRQDVTRAQQVDALMRVFKAVDADAYVLIEAPDDGRTRSTRVALENFSEAAGLRQSQALLGFSNNTQQEIALLYDPKVVRAKHDPRESGFAPRFDTELHLDLDQDAQGDRVEWSKPPLEIELESAGQTVRVIGVHAKSKAPYGAQTPEEATRISISNRRKQLAQCIWLRRRVEEHLSAGEPLIVAGDFNDGPGFDEFEKLFGRSGVEVVLGEAGKNCLYDPHATQALSSRFTMPTTSRFWLPHEGRYLQALLDYIMVSADLRKKAREWRIWHPFDDPFCFSDPVLRDALLTASDHFPVSLDLDLA